MSNESVKKQNEEYINKEVKFGLDFYYDVLNNLRTNETFRNLDISKRMDKMLENPDYKEFNMKYPIISKLLVQAEQFHPKAFKKYLIHLNTIKPTKEERAECLGNPKKQMLWKNQIDAYYYKMLYLEQSNTHNMQEANRQYNFALENLNKETEQFFKIYEEEVKKRDQKKSKNVNELREELKASLINKLYE
jgi:hypothetical protein